MFGPLNRLQSGQASAKLLSTVGPPCFSAMIWQFERQRQCELGYEAVLAAVGGRLPDRSDQFPGHCRVGTESGFFNSRLALRCTPENDPGLYWGRRAPSFSTPCKVRPSCPILVMDSYKLYDWYTTMTRLNVSKAREEFPEVVNRAAYGKERTIVSRRWKDLAAVIPIEDLRLLERLAQEEMDRIDLADARAALKEAEEKGTIPLRELVRELGD